MGVRFKRGATQGFLLCDADGCKSRSAFYDVLPDDPVGSVCEQAHQTEGWTSTYGLLSAIVGRLTYCPRCRGAAENRSAESQ